MILYRIISLPSLFLPFNASSLLGVWKVVSFPPYLLKEQINFQCYRTWSLSLSISLSLSLSLSRSLSFPFLTDVWESALHPGWLTLDFSRLNSRKRCLGISMLKCNTGALPWLVLISANDRKQYDANIRDEEHSKTSLNTVSTFIVVSVAPQTLHFCNVSKFLLNFDPFKIKQLTFGILVFF